MSDREPLGGRSRLQREGRDHRTVGVAQARAWVDPPFRRGEVFAAALLLIFCTSVYLLGAAGHFGTIDGEIVFRVTDSLYRHGSPAIACDEAMPNHSLPGRGGRCFGLYGLGQLLAITPLYWAGRALESVIGGVDTGTIVRFTVSLFNQFVTPLAVVVVFLTARLIYRSVGSALAVAVLYAFGTLAWPYSRYFFAHPLTALWLGVSFYAAAISKQARDSRVKWALLVSGAAMGLALSVRWQANLAVLPMAAYVGLTAPPGRRVRHLLVWAGAFAPFAFASLGYNHYRFGNPLDSGYPSSDLTMSIFKGVAGLMVSPGKGLFLFSPILILGVLGLVEWARKGRGPEAMVVAGTAGLYALAHGLWFDWPGGASWGPRFLVEICFFLVLPVGSFLHRPLLVWPLGLLSVAIQLLGVLVPLGKPLEWTGAFADPDLYFSWGGSQVLAHLSYLVRGEPLDPALGQITRWGLPPIGHWIAGLLAIVSASAGLRVAVLAGGALRRRRTVGWRLATAVAVGLSGLVAFFVAKPDLSPRAWPPIPRVALADQATTRGADSLNVEFGQLLRLVASSVEPVNSTLSPGSALVLDTVWKPLEELSRAWNISVSWRDLTTGEAISHEDEPLGREPLETRVWLPGETYRVRSFLTVPFGLPSGRYGLTLRVYAHEEPYPLPIREYPNRVPDFDSPVVAELTVIPGDAPTLDMGERLRYGDSLELARLKMTPERISQGSDLRMEFHWQASGGLPSDKAIFLHLLDERGWRVTQVDESVQAAFISIGKEQWVSIHTLSLPANLPAGKYVLLAGLYDPITGERTPAFRSGARVWGDAPPLAIIEVGALGLQWP